jgi:hypothetical protein
MNYCGSCGAALSVGRFCTNCGAAVPEPAAEQTRARMPAVPADPAGETTAEQTRLRMPAVAPDAGSGSRYPLYADELSEEDRAGWAPPPAPGEARTARRPVLWLGAVVLTLLLTAVLGVWLATGDDGRPAESAAGSDGGEGDAGETSPAEEPSDDAPPPSADDLAPQAQVTGPAPLPPGQDLAGGRVTYPLTNLLDGDPATAYRTAGDATGSVLTFTLPAEAEIREVGLVNGYAKTDSAGGRSVSWYPLNRKVTRVSWTFDDGTTVEQDLRFGTDLQTIAVDGVRTTTVELRLVEVSAPGTGPLRKNVTAIGDVLLRAAS